MEQKPNFGFSVGLWSIDQTSDFLLDYGAAAKLGIFCWIMDYVGLWSSSQTLDFLLDYGASAKLRIFCWILEHRPNLGFSVGLWIGVGSRRRIRILWICIGTTSLGLPSMKCPLPIMLPQSFEGFIWITTGSANFGIFGFLWITLDYGAAANSGFWMPT